MYLPTFHKESDVDVMHALIRSHPLGVWVTQADGELLANHIPFLLDASRGEHGTLVAHVARANPVWQVFSRTSDSIIVFNGADTYVTPSWYPSKQAHGKAVPTWNYAVVHAHGIPRVVEDRDWLLDQLHKLTKTHEADRPMPWKISDAPPDYIESMLNAIVGIEIPIARLVGKWKVSQNRPEQDKLGVVEGLLTNNDDESRRMASMVARHVAPTGS